MANLPQIQGANISNLAGIAGVKDLLEQLSTEAFSGFGGSPYRILKAGTTSFEIVEGGTSSFYDYNDLFGVLLASSPNNHCTWYKTGYNPKDSKNHTPPDLIWEFDSFNNLEASFPDALPPNARVKHFNPSIGKEVWDFAIRRRTVWAIYDNGALDLERPVILDLTSSTLFGDNQEKEVGLKWGELASYCKQLSLMVNLPITPSVFITQFRKGANGIYFKPYTGPQGQVQFLPGDIIQRVLSKSREDDILKLARVVQKLSLAPQDTVIARPDISNPQSVAAYQQQHAAAAQQRQQQQPVMTASQVVTPVTQVVSQPAPQPVPQPAPQPVPQPAPQQTQPVPQSVQSVVQQAQPAPQPAPQAAPQAPVGTAELLSQAMQHMNQQPQAATTQPVSVESSLQQLANLF